MLVDAPGKEICGIWLVSRYRIKLTKLYNDAPATEEVLGMLCIDEAEINHFQKSIKSHILQRQAGSRISAASALASSYNGVMLQLQSHCANTMFLLLC